MLKSFALLALVLFTAACGEKSSAPAAQSVYDKVMASGEINCGWAIYAPYFTKDANTGQFGGVVYDVMQEVGKRLTLKLNYTSEVGWGSVIEDMRNHKIDMACTYFWASPQRARYVEFTQPLVYDKLWIYVRADDTHTWSSYADFNKPELKAVTIDGSAEGKILDIRFPKAQRITLPELNSFSDYFNYVTTGKADFFVMDEGTASVYIAANPGKLKRVELPEPAHVFPGVMLLPAADPQFKTMIDTALREMDLDGTLTAILQKYDLNGKVGRAVYTK